MQKVLNHRGFLKKLYHPFTNNFIGIKSTKQFFGHGMNSKTLFVSLKLFKRQLSYFFYYLLSFRYRQNDCSTNGRVNAKELESTLNNTYYIIMA